jgi:S-adenosylmethionine synthetase
MENKRLFTSESVGRGHPDKICDQISDAILDELIKLDPHSRVAVNASIKNNKVFVFGEVTSKAKIDYKKVTLNVLREIGLTEDFKITTEVSTQSPEISQGVDTGGAGDQGSMFGYATNETKEFMPYPIALSHELMKQADKDMRSGKFKSARPDMKAQVTFNYETNQINTIVMAVQHTEDYDQEKFKRYILNKIMKPVAKKFGLNTNFKYYINNTGSFIVGGSYGDSGLTGRKIIVDTYGSAAHHGGGAFSGKDLTKLDRSGAYAARWIAKNIVAAGLANRCEIQVSYAIGKAEPVSVSVDTFGTGKVSDADIESAVKVLFPLSPSWIADNLDLRKPIYKQTAVFGHFGRSDVELPWEKLSLVNKLKLYLRTNFC